MHQDVTALHRNTLKQRGSYLRKSYGCEINGKAKIQNQGWFPPETELSSIMLLCVTFITTHIGPHLLLPLALPFREMPRAYHLIPSFFQLSSIQVSLNGLTYSIQQAIDLISSGTPDHYHFISNILSSHPTFTDDLWTVL